MPMPQESSPSCVGLSPTLLCMKEAVNDIHRAAEAELERLQSTDNLIVTEDETSPFQVCRSAGVSVCCSFCDAVSYEVYLSDCREAMMTFNSKTKLLTYLK